MHRLVLGLESKYVLRALSPGLAVRGVYMRKYMSNAIFKLADGVGVGVKVASAVVFSVEVRVRFQGVVAVNRDLELDAIAVGFNHNFVETIQDRIII